MAKAVTNALELPGKSLDFVKNNWKMFILVNILSVLSGIAALFDSSNNSNDRMFGGVGSGPFTANGLADELGVGIGLLIVFAIVAIFLNAMNTVLQLRASKGQKPDFKTLVEAAKKYWLPLIGLEILSALMVLGGLVLLIVPGIIILGRIIYAPFFMVDRDLSIVDSLKASNELSKAHQGVTWGAIGVYILVNIAGSFLAYIPRIGMLLSVLFVVAYSLVLSIRYIELRPAKSRPSSI